eukprot:8256802-Pyramimonas_sp.AAC.3
MGGLNLDAFSIDEDDEEDGEEPQTESKRVASALPDIDEDGDAPLSPMLTAAAASSPSDAG